MSPKKRSRPTGGTQLSLSLKVRIFGILENVNAPKILKNGKVSTRPNISYTVRWVVDGENHRDTFATFNLADAWRSKLLGYQRDGVPFDIHSGLPEPLARLAAATSWYEHAIKFVDLKWRDLAPKSRSSVAESLSRATTALTTTTRGAPKSLLLRQALEHYVFNTAARTAGPPPEPLAAAVEWISKNTIPMTDLQDPTQGPALARAMLDRIAIRVDNGKPAAPNTITRRRAVVYGCLDYAVERGILSANPFTRVKWSAPLAVTVVDRRTVVNPTQARAFLNSVRTSGPRGPRLVAFFALMYWAGLRPSEALHVRRRTFIDLPETGWGEGLLDRSNPRGGRRWTDNGHSREERQLKHRAVGATRPFPVHPELVTIIKTHCEEFNIGHDDLLFLGPRGGLLAEWAYLETFHQARLAVLTPAEAASPLLDRPYSLRHACVSMWLNAGVPATQVAEWAGQSVAVLLSVYAACLVGQDQAARRNIEAASRIEEVEADQPAEPKPSSPEVANGDVDGHDSAQ